MQLLTKKNKCTKCDGHGKIVLTRPCDLYRCGYANFAETCPTCLGSGRLMPVPIYDEKMLAAGGN